MLVLILRLNPASVLLLSPSLIHFISFHLISFHFSPPPVSPSSGQLSSEVTISTFVNRSPLSGHSFGRSFQSQAVRSFAAVPRLPASTPASTTLPLVLSQSHGPAPTYASDPLSLNPAHSPNDGARRRARTRAAATRILFGQSNRRLPPSINTLPQIHSQCRTTICGTAANTTTTTTSSTMKLRSSRETSRRPSAWST